MKTLEKKRKMQASERFFFPVNLPNFAVLKLEGRRVVKTVLEMGSKAQETWAKCLTDIRGKIHPAEYEAWFAPIQAVSLVGETLTIRLPSHFFYEQLEGNYIRELTQAIAQHIGQNARLNYDVVMDRRLVPTGGYSTTYPKGPDYNQSPQLVNLKAEVQGAQVINPFVIPGVQQIKIDPQLRPEYSFENFVVGSCNEVAYKIGQSLCTKWGSSTAFNPFFIHGGSGLGKTHLAQAIGLGIRKRFPNSVVLYVRAAQFIAQFAMACQTKKTNEFVNFYQNIGVLIFDDVHELAPATSTQQALFGIFNHLHQHGNQLIFTSIQNPANLQGLRQELVSRLKWGANAELTAPDYETRLAILRHKRLADGMECIPDDVLECIARKVDTNIREMEGVMISLIPYSSLSKQRITVALAEEKIASIVRAPHHRSLAVEEIQSLVANHYHLAVEEMQSNTRNRDLVLARQVAMYLARRHTDKNLESIGRIIGNKSHATVLHSCRTVEQLLATDKHLANDVKDLESQLVSLSAEAR